MSQKCFTNTECQYYPCHTIKEGEVFNCLFCYCPLYALGTECGGNFTYTADGIKDCSNCTLPHQGEKGYDHITEHIGDILRMTTDKEHALREKGPKNC